MPPLRTTTPTPANKTERSHAENQERAYIAASRRNDRSLEARVESARRASEIHKRRTGRSLRITEQDVLNEEMYEEEDDDLPLHYRRLAAHWHTGSAHFNARLAAYLSNQVAMRNAMASIHQNTLTHQYPPNPHYHTDAFQSSIIHSSEPLCSPISFSSASYPSPPFQAMPKPPHMITPISNPIPTTTPLVPRQSIHSTQMSTPAIVPQGASAPTHVQSQNPQCNPAYDSQPQPANFLPQPQYHPTFSHHNGPFNTPLPPEAQKIVGLALDTAYPFTASLMNSSENYIPSSNPNCPWGANPIASVNDMPLLIHSIIPNNSSSSSSSSSSTTTTTLAPSSLAAIATTLTANHAPSDPASTPHTPNSPNAPDMHKDNSTPPSDFGFDNNNSSSQEANNELLLSASYPQHPPSQTQLSSSTPPKLFLPKDTAAVESAPLDSDQNPPGPDGFGDHFLRDATWYNHDDFVPTATATAT